MIDCNAARSIACDSCKCAAVYRIAADGGAVHTCSAHAHDAWYILALTVAPSPRILHLETGVELTLDEAILIDESMGWENCN